MNGVLISVISAIFLASTCLHCSAMESIKLPEETQRLKLYGSVVKYDLINDENYSWQAIEEDHETKLKIGLRGRRLKMGVDNFGPGSFNIRINPLTGNGTAEVHLDLVRAYDMARNHENPYKVFSLGISKIILDGINMVRTIPQNISGAVGEVKNSLTICQDENVTENCQPT